MARRKIELSKLEREHGYLVSIDGSEAIRVWGEFIDGKMLVYSKTARPFLNHVTMYSCSKRPTRIVDPIPSKQEESRTLHDYARKFAENLFENLAPSLEDLTDYAQESAEREVRWARWKKVTVQPAPTKEGGWGESSEK